MSDQYDVPLGQQRFKLEIKRSQFITTVGETLGVDAAQSFIEKIRLEMPDANHHCWAFVAGEPSNVFQIDQSDDGEPKGTAGKPILNVLQHAALGHATVVVTRYFGGIKLGAGGLVRAYTQSASQALSQLETYHLIATKNIEIQIAYPLLDQINYWLENHTMVIEESTYADNVTMVIKVPISSLEKTKTELEAITQGRISWREKA